MQSCIAENEKQIQSYDQMMESTQQGAERVIELYEERIRQMEYSNNVAANFQEEDEIELLFDNLYFYTMQSGEADTSKRYLFD